MSTKWIQLANLPADVKLVAVRLVAQSKITGNLGRRYFYLTQDNVCAEGIKDNAHKAWNAEVNKRSAIGMELTALGWEENPSSRFDIFRQISSDNKPL